MKYSFWVLRCVAHLRKLRPDIEPDDAMRIARSALLRTTDQAPEQAAQFFAVDAGTYADVTTPENETMEARTG